MHGMLALRQDFLISHEDKTISGLDWISTGPVFRGEHWFERTAYGGQAHPYSVPYAFEGHINQFLAILSMSGLSLDHEFGTANGRITMRDMLTNAQKTVNEKEEITWTLWALSRYLPPEAQWRNNKGESWSIERLVKMQTDKPLQGAPCGGTHGLFALAHARNVYLRKGIPLRGVWLESEHKIRKYIYTARTQQNSDGSLSSNFFRGREYKQDFDKRMASAGHVLEFLMIAMPQEELSEPWIRRAIEATCNDLMKNRHEYVSCSPLYHTVNALSIYLERVAPAVEAEKLAVDPELTRTISSPKEIKTKEPKAEEVKPRPAGTMEASTGKDDKTKKETTPSPKAETVVIPGAENKSPPANTEPADPATVPQPTEKPVPVPADSSGQDPATGTKPAENVPTKPENSGENPIPVPLTIPDIEDPSTPDTKKDSDGPKEPSAENADTSLQIPGTNKQPILADSGEPEISPGNSALTAGRLPVRSSVSESDRPIPEDPSVLQPDLTTQGKTVVLDVSNLQNPSTAGVTEESEFPSLKPIPLDENLIAVSSVAPNPSAEESSYTVTEVRSARAPVRIVGPRTQKSSSVPNLLIFSSGQPVATPLMSQSKTVSSSESRPPERSELQGSPTDETGTKETPAKSAGASTKNPDGDKSPADKKRESAAAEWKATRPERRRALSDPRRP